MSETSTQAGPGALSVACGKCKTENTPDAKFCAGCGQHLEEPCPQCAVPVRLDQKFCGSCGANLQESLQKRVAMMEQMLVDSVAAAKNHQYDESLGLLERVLAKSDHRLANLQNQAATAKQKIEILQEKMLADRNDRVARAQQAANDGNHVVVIQTLGDLPDALLDNDSRSLLAGAKQFVDEVQALETETQESINRKDWLASGGSLGRLLTLIPGHPTYSKLASGVSDKISDSAEALFQRGRFGRALEYLQSIPSACQSERTDQLMVRAEDLKWLVDQFADQPLATPSLGRLAMRIKKEAPQDPKADERIKKLSEALQGGRRDVRSHLPRYEGSGQSVMGGALDYLSHPQGLDWSAVDVPAGLVGRLTVACGLAIAGLGKGREISPLWTPASKLLSSLRRKKVNRVWGVDIGSSSIKAVLVEADEQGELHVQQIEQVSYPVSIARSIARDEQDEIIRDAASELSKRITDEEIPLWTSFRACETINYFVRLPPVARKQAEKLFEAERNETIPLALEDVAMSDWRADVDGVNTSGIPGGIVSTRRKSLDAFVELLSSVDLKPSALVSESVALVHFAHHEFADELARDETSTDSGYPSVAIVDVGSESTKIAIVSELEHWFGHHEVGGEGVTSRMSRGGKLTRAAAEKMKFDVASLTSPASTWGAINDYYDSWRNQLKRFRIEAEKHSSYFDIQSTWCVGGASLTHDFLRKVIQKHDA